MLITAPAAAQDQYHVCRSKFALCTTATCEKADDPEKFLCNCEVLTDYSLGKEECKTQPEWNEKTGALIVKSRYFPLVS